MFTARINELFQHLGAKNGQVAKLAGFDRTNISHFRSGKRVPKREGAAFRSLVFGILLYYD
ncbi:MAG: helix-turn-helix transcriptional regulator, partial [Lachnospiraceae bacterium]|nr:helix-turn-helix transcriptional regulator [Lachnospiraceae bacterium]